MIASLHTSGPVSYTHLNILSDHVRSLGRYVTLQRQPPGRIAGQTAQAALQIACDLVDEGMRTEEEAVAMIDPRNLDTLLHPQFDTAALKAATPMGKGLGASPGAACGKVVFTAEDACLLYTSRCV